AGHTTFRGGIAGDADCILIPEVGVDFDVVYRHMKKVFTRRVNESEYRTGTYLIVVNEGIQDETGSSHSDDSVSVDAFGHKKLGGSGKYVREQLAKRLKNDPEMEEFYKKTGLYVEGMNVLPEVRESVPGYLTRSGYSSALDVNFGKDAGAGAVVLLTLGIRGVTVAGLYDGTVQYMSTQKAIEQRMVSLENISFYEQMDVCFGRNVDGYLSKSDEVTNAWSYL
ncbi:MAG: 6-phosphofructokinase, partial [Paludibacter sp.]